MARRGEAGEAGRGSAWRGEARQVRLGKAGPGEARPGEAGRTRRGKARQGTAWRCRRGEGAAMRGIGAVVAILAVLAAVPAAARDCDIDWWKRDLITTHEAYYRGQVNDPDRTRQVFIELWTRRGGELIAESWAAPNPRGVFEIYIYANQRISRAKFLQFSCR